MNNNCNVLIVEDHDLLRTGLCSMLSAQMGYHVAGEAKDGREACQLAISLHLDLILMDLSLPGMNGIEAIAAIKRRAPAIHIIALSVHQNDEYVREALRAGVDGYVMKDASFDELLAAMRAVMLGRKHLSSELYRNLVESFASGHEISTSKNGWELLTARERSVLKLVAEGRSNRQVGVYLNLSPKTIEKYRASLMRKLGISNLTELVLVAINLGLITSAAKKYYDPDHDVPVQPGQGRKPDDRWQGSGADMPVRPRPAAADEGRINEPDGAGNP